MVAMGVYGHGTYLADSWNRLDFFIVMAGSVYNYFTHTFLVRFHTVTILKTMFLLKRNQFFYFYFSLILIFCNNIMYSQPSLSHFNQIYIPFATRIRTVQIIKELNKTHNLSSNKYSINQNIHQSSQVIHNMIRCCIELQHDYLLLLQRHTKIYMSNLINF